MIAAIYARKSTEQNGVSEEQKSVERQVENARAFAALKGWTVAADHVYVDDAISGAETLKLRAKHRLLEVIRSRRAPFDVLVMQSSDRFSRRDGADAFIELKSIVKAGVEIWFYAKRERFTFGTFESNIIGFVSAEVNAQWRRMIADKTFEAMVRKAQAGHVTGGTVFGYTNVPVLGSDGKRSHVEYQINEREAAVVRRIFELCAKGVGKTKTARMLNEEGAPCSRRACAWSGSSVFEMLQRPLYRGVVVWNRSKKRNVEGEQHQHPKPAADWIQVEAAHLRIIPEELWQAAHARLERSRSYYLLTTKGKLWGKPLNPIDGKYLLTGLGECGFCHGSLEVRTRAHGPLGRRGQRVSFYACATHRRSGTAICRGLEWRMDEADEAVLSLIEAWVLDREMLQEACARALDGTPSTSDPDARRAELSVQRADVERQIGRLTDVLANGAGDSRAVLLAIQTREATIAQIDRELARLARTSPIVTPERVQAALNASLSDWRSTLRKHAPLARQLLTKLLRGRVVFTPESRNEQPGYRVRGQATVATLLNAVLKSEGAQTLEGGDLVAQGVASPTGFEPVFWP